MFINAVVLMITCYDYNINTINKKSRWINGFNSDWFSAVRHEKGKTILLSDDTNRFPAYEKVYDYATKVNKTEEFLKRLEQSVKHLKDYCEETYSNEYLIDFGPAEEKIVVFRDGTQI